MAATGWTEAELRATSADTVMRMGLFLSVRKVATEGGRLDFSRDEDE